ncbi:MAG: LamG-like jellyroll fold domain-containing protein [Sandaracinaceae bacterium]
MVAWLAAMAGCGRIGFEQLPARSGPDAGHRGDGGGQDPVDGGSPLRCPPPDDDTVALFTFDGDDGTTFPDSLGGPAGQAEGSVARVDGPPGCGRALRFTEDQASFVAIADDPRWDLPVGTVDLMVRPRRCGRAGRSSTDTFISRDALNRNEPGHFLIALDRDCRLVYRLQVPAREVLLVSDRELTLGAWHHVAATFGPEGLELWQDGQLVATDPGEELEGLGDNANPWTLGASTRRSRDGDFAPTSDALRDGDVDHVRISRVRRRFGG